LFDSTHGGVGLGGITGGHSPYYVKVEQGTGTCASFTPTSTPLTPCLTSLCTSLPVNTHASPLGAGTYTYRVTVTDSSTPTLSACCLVVLTVNPLPSCSISGPSSVCAAGSVTLSGPSGNYTYLWSSGAKT